MRPDWLTAVIDSKKEENIPRFDWAEVQNLSGNRKHEFTTKHKHRFEEGHLQIVVMKARNIHPETFSSEPDHYVQITMGEQRATSGTVRADPNPEWDFQMGIQISQNTPKYIHFEVFDKKLRRYILGLYLGYEL